ncbi:MAG: phosphatidylglycerophosphatase A [Halorhodospira sp.]
MGNGLDGIAVWLATGLDLTKGGTSGELVIALLSLPLAYSLLRCSRRTQVLSITTLVVLALLLCQIASQHFATKDSSRIVADEFLTFPVAIAAQSAARHPGILGGTYLLSRALDGVKPSPARQAEDLPDGIGIVADDLITNGYTALLLATATRLWRRQHPSRRW